MYDKFDQEETFLFGLSFRNGYVKAGCVDGYFRMKIKAMPCIISSFPDTFGAILVVHLPCEKKNIYMTLTTIRRRRSLGVGVFEIIQIDNQTCRRLPFIITKKIGTVFHPSGRFRIFMITKQEH